MPPSVRVSGPYRDYRIGAGRKRGRGRALFVALGLLIAIAAGWFAVGRSLAGYRSLRSATAAVREGDRSGAAARFEKLLGQRFLGPAARDGLGLVALLEGDLDAARRHFSEAGPGEVRFSPLVDDSLVVGLLDAGDYERAELLASQARLRQDSPALRMYQGIALNGLDQIGPAREAMAGGPLRSVFERMRRGDNLLLGGVFRDEKVLRLYANHVKSLVDKERTGRRAWLWDSHGKPLFRVTIKTGEAEAPSTTLGAAVFGPDGKGGGLDRFVSAIDRRNRVETTLDPEIQRLAWDALKSYRGTMVVLGTDGAVLAAAARDNLRYRRLRRGVNDERPVPDPFATLFTIASVSKVPALTAALTAAGTAEAVFPFTCKGSEKIAGRLVYDSRRHGLVADSGHALALSCNLAFGELALRCGRERLLAGFADFGFGRAAADPMQPAPLAVIDPEPADPSDLAALGIGLGAARSTAVGTAAIALAIATGGEYREPFVFKQKITIGGVPYAVARPAARRVASPEVAAAVAEAMARVVSDADGTGHRAQHEILTLAAKTGTAGNDRDGYEALMAGFVPARAPRLAFAIYLNGTGRAEWDAAMATRRFLDGLHALEEDRAREKKSPW